AYPAVTTTAELTAALDSQPDAEPVAVFGALTRRLERTSTGDFVVLIAAGRGGLSLRTDGIYPIGLDIAVGGELRARITTAINFFGPTTTFTKMKVSLLVGAPATTGKPASQPDGSIAVDSPARNALENLVSIGSAEGGPLTLAIEPEVIDGLARSSSADDIALLTRLEAVMQRHESVRMPYVPFDPSSAQRASLGVPFRELLTTGRDVLDVHNGEAPLNSQAWIARQPLDKDGVEILKANDVTTIVLTPNASQASGSLDNYLKTYRVGSTVDNSVAVKAIDPKYAELLSGDRPSPVVDAARIAASLILSRSAVEASGGDVRRLHAILGDTRGEVPAPLVAIPLLVALDRAPQLNLVGVSRTNTVTSEDSTTSLPTISRIDLTANRASIDEATSFVRITESILSATSPLRYEWDRSLLVLNDDRLDAVTLDTYVKGIRSRARLLRNSITIPDGLSFTLGSREGTLRLPIRNESNEELTFGVSLSSAKLQLPGDIRVVTVSPQGSVDVVVDVVARANGRFPVDVTFTSPDGAHKIGQTIRIGARVTAISGLGQLVSGAAVLILATWWVAHWRARKRRDAVEKHPAIR
ncbi:MAG: DUF6049 family protein, partial [Ilumatobacteraceae bacterium]